MNDETPPLSHLRSVLPRCIGYGKKDNRKANEAKHCKNRADTPARLWCSECDAERKKSITASMDDIDKAFGRAGLR